MVSKSSSEPGPWRTDRVPYVREIQDLLSWDSDVETVVWMKGSQVAGTETILNWAGYTMHVDPWPMMIVEPSLKPLAERLAKQRLDPMIEASEPLRQAVSPARSRDSGNTTYTKEYPGGILMLAGANSAAGLRQASIAKLALDEIDEYPPDVDGQGDPLELAKARTRRFPRRKIYVVSSPTIEGSSRIAKLFETTDRAYYHVPCPDCGHFQRLVWGQVKYERDLEERAIPESARYCCQECGSLIPEHKKSWMFERGRWVSEVPERRGKVRGFHLSALYSPVGTFSWAECVELWRDAQGNPELLKTFVNTILGETWKGTGDSPPWERLYNRREHYAIGVVPKGALVLTAGVDVQGGSAGNARIEYEVVGWGPRFESWSIEYGTIRGELANEDVRAQLVRALERSFPVSGSSLSMPVRMIAVDAGFDTQNVYAFVRSRSQQQWIAVKGTSGYPLLVGHPMRADVAGSGKMVRRGGMKSWPVGVDIAKRQLYAWLKAEQPVELERTGYPDGWCHFPQYAQEYFRQLCSERVQPKKDARGFVRWEWVANGRNEALDCRVYARAAAAVLQLDRYTPEDWKTLAAMVAGSGAAKRRAAPRRVDDGAEDYWGRHG
jgi:phage terminase large subunit GpA-like protein